MSVNLNNTLQYDLKDDDIVYFLHIPKTAGTTFIAILDSFFDADSIYPEKVWHELLKKDDKEFSKYKLVRGHFGYNIRQVLHKKPIYVTMLRDPIERTISQFEHIRKDKYGNNWVSENFLSHDELLSDLLKDKDKRGRLGNSQTRYIGLDCDVFDFTKDMDEETLNNFRFDENLYKFQNDVSNENILENAKKRVLESTYFGITERFEESMFLLFYTFGWRPIKNMWRLNVSAPRPHKQDLPEETKLQIESWNEFDRQLYDFALKQFEERISIMNKTLRDMHYQPSFEKLPYNEMMFKMLSKNYEDRVPKNENLSKKINYDFSEKLSGSGWYYRESIPEKGISYRWTGPETKSTIDLALRNDEDLMVLFHVLVAASPRILDKVRLKVNRYNVDLKIAFRKEESRYFEGRIPKESLQVNEKFTRLKFILNETINPHEKNLDDPTDRKIGIAVDRIKLIPLSEYNAVNEILEIEDNSSLKNQKQIMKKLENSVNENKKILRELKVNVN